MDASVRAGSDGGYNTYTGNLNAGAEVRRSVNLGAMESGKNAAKVRGKGG